MVFTRTQDFNFYRKECIATNGSVDCSKLFAYCLEAPFAISRISSITKQYVHLENGTRLNYPSHNAGYWIFDSEREAWQYRHMVFQRYVEQVEFEMSKKREILENGKKEIAEKIESNPEFFIG